MRIAFIVLLFAFLSSFHVLKAAEGCVSDTTVCDDYSCCSKDDPTPAGMMLTHIHKKNEWMISYMYMNMYMDGNLNGINRIDKETIFSNYTMSSDNMKMEMHMLMLMYGLSNRFTAMGLLNYNRNYMEMSMFAGGHNHNALSTSNPNMTMDMTTSGISDFRLYLLYGLILKSNQQLIVSSGINIPLSEMQASTPYSMQLSSGTYDFFPVISYLFQDGKFVFNTQVSASIRNGSNTNGYSLGNEITSNLWASFQWHRMISSSLRMEGNYMEQIHGSDPSIYYFDDITSNPFNYGGKRLQLYAGTVFQFKKTILKNMKFAAEYGMPLYQNLNGIQMEGRHLINFKCNWSF